VAAVGFDFIRTPELQLDCGVIQGEGEAAATGFIRIQTFKSEALVRDLLRKRGNRETLSMVMLDYDFDDRVQRFDLDVLFYAGELEKEEWTLRFPLEALGQKMMAVFIDIYGNEAREVIPAEQFKPPVNIEDKRDTVEAAVMHQTDKPVPGPERGKVQA
jgi:hypothetical protein